MSDLLIEIGVEELPSNVIRSALAYIKNRLESILERKDIETFGTPRRLAFIVRNFRDFKKVEEEIVFGPPWEKSFDVQGNPTPALKGFLAKYSAKGDMIFKASKGRGEYVALKLIKEEASALEKLEESFEDILISVPFPKRMRWLSDKRITFSRPIRWIVGLYGDRVLNLHFGNLKAGRRTKGHRLLSEGWIELKTAEDYLKRLEENFVIPEVEKRKQIILKALEEEAKKRQAQLEYPQDLLEEVTNLVEYPFIVAGSFEKKFLELPSKVVVTVCAHHQRFFCLSKEGKLINEFLGVSNNKPEGNVVREGYERVIKARLEDALFFYREDQKKKLEDLVPQLAEILIHPKVGTVLDKVNRLRKITAKLCERFSHSKEEREKADRAAFLSKADLLTEMVKEFDELQGYMGYVYALLQGEDKDVALAIYEQYKPADARDKLPSTFIGAVLSLADKIDTLISFFKAREIPTGSSDPYSLRRCALGILRIINDRKWDVDLRDFRDIYGSGKWEEELEGFLRQRLESYLENIRYDYVKAVLAVKNALRPYEIIKNVYLINSVQNSSILEGIYETYRRVVRIIPKDWKSMEVKTHLFQENAEISLWKIVEKMEKQRDIDLQDLFSLKNPIDKFFDSVLIMDNDRKIRENRLALLMRVKFLFNRIADFSKLVF